MPINTTCNVTTRLVDILEKDVDESYYLSEEKTRKLTLNEDLSGRLNHYDYRDVDSVHSVNRVSPTLNTMQGGGRQPKVAVVGNTSNTHYDSHNVHDPNGLSPTITARDYKGPKQVAIPVLTPDRVNKRQNGRRFKEDNDPMFTLTSQDRHGIAIKEATKKGYPEAMEGDSVNTSFPNSKTRRGRVGKQVAQTLQAGEVNQGVVIDDTQNFDGVRVYKNIAPTLRSGRSGLKTIVEENEQNTVLGVGHHPFSKKLEFNGYKTICPTLVATDYKAPKTALTKNLRIRKLTPLECWRLQGFSDEQFYKAKNSGVSKSQLYKQAGNAVTVNVVDAIVGELK